MTISVHAFSGNPRDRMVGINKPDAKGRATPWFPVSIWKQITPDGMIFGYKGYSFRRGVK